MHPHLDASCDDVGDDVGLPDRNKNVLDYVLCQMHRAVFHILYPCYGACVVDQMRYVPVAFLPRSMKQGHRASAGVVQVRSCADGLGDAYYQEYCQRTFHQDSWNNWWTMFLRGMGHGQMNKAALDYTGDGYLDCDVGMNDTMGGRKFDDFVSDGTHCSSSAGRMQMIVDGGIVRRSGGDKVLQDGVEESMLSEELLLEHVTHLNERMVA